MITTFSDKVWKIYIFWAFWVGIVFFSVYPTCNWLTSQRPHVLNLYFASELSVPFVPEFVWAYISMNILLLMPPFFLGVSNLNVLGKQLVSATLFSAIIFLFFPAKLGFGRSVPEEPVYETLFTNLFSVDMPYNMVPSLHVVFSAIIVFAITDGFRTMLVKFVWWAWLMLICMSTLLVHQHHLLDLIAGLVVAWLFHSLLRKGENHV
jgi:membrane-associated phospholipid phosphatase